MMGRGSLSCLCEPIAEGKAVEVLRSFTCCFPPAEVSSELERDPEIQRYPF